MDTQTAPTTPNPPARMYAILHPSGQLNLRTVHPTPHGAITRAENDHQVDWADLYKRGHRLATLSVAIDQVHQDVYTTVYSFLQRQEGAQ